MYAVSTVHDPRESADVSVSFWIIDIDYIDLDTASFHYQVIRVHAVTLTLGLLRAKYICALLNGEVFKTAEDLVTKIELTKNAPRI